MNPIEAIIKGAATSTSDAAKGAARTLASTIPNPASTVYNLGLGIGPLIRNIVEEMKKNDSKKQSSQRGATAQEQQGFAAQLTKQNQLLFRQMAASTTLLKEIRDVQRKQLALIERNGKEVTTRIIPREQKSTVLQRLFGDKKAKDEEASASKGAMGDMDFGALNKVLGAAGVAVLIGTLFKKYQNLPESERKEFEKTLGEAKTKIVGALQETVISSIKGLIETAWSTSKLGTVLAGVVVAKMTGVLDAMVLAAKAGGSLWRGASVYGKTITNLASGGSLKAGGAGGGGAGAPAAYTGAPNLSNVAATAAISSGLLTQQAVERARIASGTAPTGPVYGLDRSRPDVTKASERLRGMRERAEANRIAREGTGPRYGGQPFWLQGQWASEAARYNRILNTQDPSRRFQEFRRFESEMGPNMQNVKDKYNQMYGSNASNKPIWDNYPKGQPGPVPQGQQPPGQRALPIPTGQQGGTAATGTGSKLSSLGGLLGKIAGRGLLGYGVFTSGQSAMENYKQGNNILAALDTISAATGAGALGAAVTGVGLPAAAALGATSIITAIASAIGSYFVDKKPAAPPGGRAPAPYGIEGTSITGTEHGTFRQQGVGVVNFDSARFNDLTEEQKLAFLDGQARAEGFGRAGTIPTTHNNPGAIMMGSFASSFGATAGKQALNGPVIAHFPTLEAGRLAHRALWESGGYRDLTIAKGLQRWHNASPEAAANYAATIVQRMKEGGEIATASAPSSSGMGGSADAVALSNVSSTKSMAGLMFADLQNQFNAAASIISNRQVKMDLYDIMNQAGGIKGNAVGAEAPPTPPSSPPLAAEPSVHSPVVSRSMYLQSRVDSFA